MFLLSRLQQNLFSLNYQYFYCPHNLFSFLILLFPDFLFPYSIMQYVQSLYNYNNFSFSVYVHGIWVILRQKPYSLLLWIHYDHICSLYSFHQSRSCWYLLYLLLSQPNLGLRQLLSLYSTSICWCIQFWSSSFHLSPSPQSLLFLPTLSSVLIQICYPLIPLFYTYEGMF